MEPLTSEQIAAIIASVLMIVIIIAYVVCRQYFTDVGAEAGKGYYDIPIIGSIRNSLQKLTTPTWKNPNGVPKDESEPVSKEPEESEPVSKEYDNVEPGSEETFIGTQRSMDSAEQKLANMYKIKEHNLAFPELIFIPEIKNETKNKSDIERVLYELSGVM